MKIRLFGLLYLKNGDHTAENFYVKDFLEKAAIYVNNAINLQHSLHKSGVEFILLTNNKSIVDEIVRVEGRELNVVEIPFLTKVPSGTRFYSAHFKIDAFRYLSALNDKYTGLCDLDMTCINDLPACFLNNIENQTPMYFDISDQVIPAYGQEVVARDLELIHHLKSEGRWSGGEFVCGSPSFFAALTTEIDNVYGNYLDVIDKLHHKGDESIVSASLEIMRRKGVYISDAGTLGIVGRYWSCRIAHPQKSFKYFEKCYLLHLPGDKRFLSDMAKKGPFDFSAFKREYAVYRKPKSIFSRAINKVVRFFSFD